MVVLVVSLGWWSCGRKFAWDLMCMKIFLIHFILPTGDRGVRADSSDNGVAEGHRLRAQPGHRRGRDQSRGLVHAGAESGLVPSVPHPLDRLWLERFSLTSSHAASRAHAGGRPITRRNGVLAEDPTWTTAHWIVDRIITHCDCTSLVQVIDYTELTRFRCPSLRFFIPFDLSLTPSSRCSPPSQQDHTRPHWNTGCLFSI